MSESTTPVIVALAVERLRSEVVERLGRLEGRVEALDQTVRASVAPAPEASPIRAAGKSGVIGAAAAGAIVGLGELFRRVIG